MKVLNCSAIFAISKLHVDEIVSEFRDNFQKMELASRSPQWVTCGSTAFLLFPLRAHFPAVLPLTLYGRLPQWPRVGAEGACFFIKSKPFSNDYLILDP